MTDTNLNVSTDWLAKRLLGTWSCTALQQLAWDVYTHLTREDQKLRLLRLYYLLSTEQASDTERAEWQQLTLDRADKHWLHLLDCATERPLVVD